MRFLIIGSCVSRDAFDGYLSKLKVTEYITRLSFGSLMRGYPTHLKRGDFNTAIPESPAMREAIEEDLSGRFEKRLDARLSDCDAVLVDFLQERFPLFLHLGHPITFSRTLQDGEMPRGGRIVQYNTEEYFALWDLGFSRFIRHARAAGRPVIVNTCLWAENPGDGRPFDLRHVRKTNDFLARMHARAGTLGARLVDYGNHEFIADTAHRFGHAPFHLTRDTERVLSTQVLKLCGGL